tara:strand:- start:3284 stop:3667 length:384 start_codon:yes stop_codon:yes gene_type:complete
MRVDTKKTIGPRRITDLFTARFPDDPSEWPIGMDVIAFKVVASVRYVNPEFVEDQDYSDGTNYVVSVKDDTVIEVTRHSDGEFPEVSDVRAIELAAEAGISMHKLGDVIGESCSEDICKLIWEDIIS